MWAAIIGAATSAASGIAGGIMSAKKNQKAKAELRRQEQRNEAWYNRRYNEDYLNTATAQHVLSQAREAAMEQMNRARGVQAVMGGTEESVEQTQRQANNMIANTEAQLAAQGQARKDSIEQQYLQRANDISNRYQSLYNAQAKNISSAAGQGVQAGMGLVQADITSKTQTGKGAFENWFKQNKTNSSPSVGNTTGVQTALDTQAQNIQANINQQVQQYNANLNQQAQLDNQMRRIQTGINMGANNWLLQNRY